MTLRRKEANVMGADYDLLIKGGRLIDPAQGVSESRDIAFKDGVVAALESDIPAARANDTLDATGLLVAPGMIDLHVHVFEGISHLGVPADASCLAHGATTVVDAGSAGADTFAGFRKYVIEVSATRIYAHLNISSQGMLSPVVGELEDLKWADVPRALEVIESNRDLILGVKVRLTRNSIVEESAGLQPLFLAREAADAAGMPIMVHPQNAWCHSLDNILDVMRDRDILTHSYHGLSHGILDDQQRIRASVRKARDRGVVFDVGHGAGSFDWEVCQTALSQGFAPDTISSDLHTGNIDGPVFDLATTVTKFLHLGLSLQDSLSRVTAEPARVLGMSEIGTLAVGSLGDAVILELEEGSFVLTDSRGEQRTGSRRLVPKRVVKGGRAVEDPALGR
jgi:dihydroorotase